MMMRGDEGQGVGGIVVSAMEEEDNTLNNIKRRHGDGA